MKLSKPWDPRHTRMQKLPLCHLKALCTYLERTDLSEFNLRGLSAHGNAAISKEVLTRLLEFLTGIGASCDLNGHAYNSLQDLADELLSLYERRGKPGEKLELPVNWPDHGCYRLMAFDDGKVQIYSRFRATSVCLDLADAGFLPGEPETLRSTAIGQRGRHPWYRRGA